MPAPPEFRSAFTAALMAALPRLIETAWAHTEKKIAHLEQRSTPRARRRGSRIQKGRTQLAVQHLLSENADEGLSRSDLRHLVTKELGLNSPVSENTLKRALMELRAAAHIETRNSRWYPVRRIAIRPGIGKVGATTDVRYDVKGHRQEVSED
jgi:hypothetical protein